MSRRGNAVVIRVEDGCRWAKGTHKRLLCKEEPKEVELPEDMPGPPTELAPHIGLRDHRKDHEAEGGRRPSFGLLDPEWACLKWRFKEERGLTNGTGTLDLWLSKRQQEMWRRQVPCRYCGIGIGRGCIARGIRWGEQDGFGLPVCRQSEATYHHQLRQRDVNKLVGKVPWELYPDWIWWSSHAVGEDPEALLVALSHARGEDFAERYVETHVRF